MKNQFVVRSLILIFFLSLLLIGLSIYKDYGVHWDEYNNQIFGHNWRVYILDVITNRSIASTPMPNTDPYPMDWVHGSVVEVTLGFIKNSLHLSSLREILFLRHLCCFLMFSAGVFIFYLVGQLIFKNRWLALLGCVFLVLSPRIFAHAFYDTFDIPFLSLYILSLYTLMRWLDQRTILNGLIHALALGLLIDTRLAGTVMAVLTFSFYLFEMIRNKNSQKSLPSLLIHLVFLGLLIILLWPLLWSNPLGNFIKALHTTLTHNFPFSCLYMGQFYLGNHLPWHYAPVWILISTPLLYCFFFLIGIYNAGQRFLKDRNVFLITLSFILPLLLAQGKLANSWRHLFFIYPSFLLLSLMGLQALWEQITKITRFKIRLLFHTLIVITTLLGLIDTAKVMLRLHPFENVYFNALAGRDMKQIKSRFEIDYWGLSFRQALEYLAKTDPAPLISVATNPTWPLVRNNLNILSALEKTRFKEAPLDEAKYFITNYLQHPDDFPFVKYASIVIGNGEIVTIYKLK